MVGEYCPAGQSKHSDEPAGEYFPAAQREQLGVPAEENDPAGQSEQDEEPNSDEYLPAGHRLHAGISLYVSIY
jgi:hypothetical protein